MNESKAGILVNLNTIAPDDYAKADVFVTHYLYTGDARTGKDIENELSRAILDYLLRTDDGNGRLLNASGDFNWGDACNLPLSKAGFRYIGIRDEEPILISAIYDIDVMHDEWPCDNIPIAPATLVITDQAGKIVRTDVDAVLDVDVRSGSVELAGRLDSYAKDGQKLFLRFYEEDGYLHPLATEEDSSCHFKVMAEGTEM